MSTTDVQTGKSKTKQRQKLFQMYISNIQAWCETSKTQKRTPSIPWKSKFSPSTADMNH